MISEPGDFLCSSYFDLLRICCALYGNLFIESDIWAIVVRFCALFAVKEELYMQRNTTHNQIILHNIGSLGDCGLFSEMDVFVMCNRLI